MTIGLETGVLGTVVVVAFAWAIRAGYRSVRHTGGCSSCSSSGNCPLTANPEALAELTRQGKTSPLESCHPASGSCADLLESVSARKPD